MQFHETGLPDTKLIRDVFAFSLNVDMKFRKESLAAYEQEVEKAYKHNLAILDRQVKDRAITEAEASQNRALIEQSRKEQLMMGPVVVDREHEAVFMHRRVRPAREVAEHCTNPSNEAIAAMLLVDCLRSPVDFKAIAHNFGQEVANTIGDIMHLEAYPSERSVAAAQVAASSRMTYLALISASLLSILDQAERLQKSNGGRLAFPAGQEDAIYASVSPLFGIDARLDARFVDNFNKTAKALSSVYTLERDAQTGTVALVKDTPGTALVKPQKPKGPANIGGDVF